MIVTVEPQSPPAAATPPLSALSAFASAAGTTNDLIRAELDRVLASTTFVRSKRLGRFLRFTVEQCLDGHHQALKEYLVGVEVFNKSETFDPRIDSIVRVEARRLRSKLERYYQTEGLEDQVVIQFRKGSYVPFILTREQYQASAFLDDTSRRRSGKKSIAVSRFTNLGVEASYSFFCYGITEDIVSTLTKLPDFRVMARQSAGSLSDDARADYVLEGSVRKQGERLRIAAQLIDRNSSVYIWSETYERDVADAFAVQDEISRSIVASLRAKFEDIPN